MESGPKLSEERTPLVAVLAIAALYDRAFLSGSWREVWAWHRRVLRALAGTWLLLAWVVVHEGGAGPASRSDRASEDRGGFTAGGC